VVQDTETKIIIQSNVQMNNAWESNIKAIKLLIDKLPIGFIEKDTEDILICEKVSFSLLVSIGNLLISNVYTEIYKNKSAFEAVADFVNLINEEKLYDKDEYRDF
jgi:3-deoxy-D-manno-octulosonate 8-phosphate phosphatase KdsC-like HAD superfamily phosphatase